MPNAHSTKSTPTMPRQRNLQRDADIPFRVGHHFASDLVTFGRSNGVRPTQIPYGAAQEIDAKAAGILASGKPNCRSAKQLSAGPSPPKTWFDPALASAGRNPRRY